MRKHYTNSAAITICNMVWDLCSPSDVPGCKTEHAGSARSCSCSWRTHSTKHLVPGWNEMDSDLLSVSFTQSVLCLKHQTRRIEFQEAGTNWNNWKKKCLGSSCSLCVWIDKERSGKHSRSILLHFCLQLRITMPLTSNPQATLKQSYIIISLQSQNLQI